MGAAPYAPNVANVHNWRIGERVRGDLSRPRKPSTGAVSRRFPLGERPANQALARISTEVACTASTSAATLSGGVPGTMPWPRLKMCPGCRTRRAHDGRRFARDGRRVREQHERIEIALQRHAIAHGGARRGDVDRPVEADAGRRRCRRSRAATSPPPLVNTIAGTCLPSGSGTEARQHAAHRRQRELAVGGGGQEAAPRVEDHHRVRARPRSVR